MSTGALGMRSARIGAPGDMAMGIHTFFKILGERAGLEAEAYRAPPRRG
jgi:hypothetical protein